MTSEEQKFQVGDIVNYMSLKGKIVKVEYNNLLGFVYLVKYGLFNKKWTFQSSLTPDCECCKNNKSMNCPNSDICHNTEEKSFYESKNQK